MKGYIGLAALLLCCVLSELFLRGLPADLELPYAVTRTLVVFFTLFFFHRFARMSLKRYRPKLRELVTLCSILAGSSLLFSIISILGISLNTYLNGQGTAEMSHGPSFLYALPFASGALIVKAVLGIHFGLVFSIALTVFVGIYFPEDPLLVLLCFVSSLVACVSFMKFRSRSAYLRAGLHIGLFSIPFAVASIILTPDLSLADVALRLLAVLFAGIMSSFVAASLTPIIEMIGGYVTDMRLLEMATLDHPLLKELSIQAPGTWNHSMVIGMMVEAGADAIGANPVLARVAAYFHDIGKMKKPLYFVENQVGENRHDKLSPSMSALIIRSHVKDGIELARKHKLPEAIVDMVPQHHGTSVIEFFYDKAKKEAEEAGDDPKEVDKSLYSYPGPKPQTREAALLLIADGIEAAARTLSEPSQDRIQGMVQKMINRVFASGQLSESELTLQDLHLIAKAYTRVLTSIHHQRIAYAEPAEKVYEKPKDASEKSEKIEKLDSRSIERPDSEENKKEPTEGADEEDLKRLGL